MATIWQSNVQQFEKLDQNISCDTTIIGGGVAGLWCAYKLAKAGQSVIVLEAKRVGLGVTAGSTAILSFAQDIVYQTLDPDTAKKYLDDSKRAIAEITNLVKCEKIKFHLFTTKRKGKRQLVRENKFLKARVVQPKLPYKTRYALEINNCYQLDPLKLVEWLVNQILKNGGKIFENTLVQNAPEENILRVKEHTITSKNFIIATHFPYITKVGLYWLKMWQDQNYCLAFPATDDFCKGKSYESIDKKGFEYRRVGDKILIDGVSVRTGKKPYRGKYKHIKNHINKYFGNSKNSARYSAQDCMTSDKLPYAGLYSHLMNNVYVVTGFNKWGMTNSYITADVVTNMILGKAKQDNIYTPNRIGISASHIGNVFLAFLAKLRPGPSCPHMGCRLKWNRDDRTWDCPCHGSRFTKSGSVISGPATKKCTDCASCTNKCHNV